MGGQVRISTVGISRLHPPTPSNFLMPGTPPPRPPGKSAQSWPRKSPCIVWFLGPPCSQDPSLRGRTTQLLSPCAPYTGRQGGTRFQTESEGLSWLGSLHLGPGRESRDPAQYPHQAKAAVCVLHSPEQAKGTRVTVLEKLGAARKESPAVAKNMRKG